jgi:hypothetical protein
MDYGKKIVKIAFVGPMEQSVKLQESLAEKLRRKIKWDTFEKDEAGYIETIKYDVVITAVGSKISKQEFVRAIVRILEQR